jgi:hypothetical protein
MLGVVGVAQWLSVCLACTRLDLIPSKKKRKKEKEKKCLISSRKNEKWDVNIERTNKVGLRETKRPISGIMTTLVTQFIASSYG